MTVKLTKNQRESVADIEKKITGLQNKYSKEVNVVKQEQETQLNRTTRVFTDKAREINDRKQVELKKLKSLADHELKVVSSKFDQLFSDLHKEFAGEFQSLENDLEVNKKGVIDQKFGAQLKDLEGVYNISMAGLQAQRDAILGKAEETEKKIQESMKPVHSVPPSPAVATVLAAATLLAK